MILWFNIFRKFSYFFGQYIRGNILSNTILFGVSIDNILVLWNRNIWNIYIGIYDFRLDYRYWMLLIISVKDYEDNLILHLENKIFWFYILNGGEGLNFCLSENYQFMDAKIKLW